MTDIKLPVALKNNPALAFTGRVLKRVFIEFRDDQCLREANAMAYRTLFSAVPLLAIFFTIFTAFGAFGAFKGKVLEFISSYLVPSAKDQIIANMEIMADNVKALSSIGLVATIIVALFLFNAIEMAFNRIWGVTEHRGLVRKFTTFTAILLWAPVFFGLSFYLTGVIQAHLPWLKSTEEVGILNRLILRLLPVFFTWAALTIIFIVVPHTQVKFKPAAIGAMVASLGWELVKLGFNYYVVHAVTYSKIYGSLSVIPIFIIGLYLLWVVVFLGAEIAYVLNNYQYHEDWTEEDWSGHKPYLAVGVMLQIGKSFKSGSASPSIDEMASRFRVAIPTLRDVLMSLMQAGVLTRGSNDKYLPSRDLNLITLEDVLDSTIEKCAVVRGVSPSAKRITESMPQNGADKLAQILGSLEKDHHDKLGNVSIEDMLEEPPSSPALALHGD